MPSPWVALFVGLGILGFSRVFLALAAESAIPGEMDGWHIAGMVLRVVGALVALIAAVAIGTQWGMAHHAARQESASTTKR